MVSNVNILLTENKKMYFQRAGLLRLRTSEPEQMGTRQPGSYLASEEYIDKHLHFLF